MSTETLPTPSKLLVVVSVLNISGNLFWAASIIGQFILVRPNSIVFGIGVFLATSFCLIAMLQYYGTFRRARGAAKKCRDIQFGLCLGAVNWSVMGIIAAPLFLGKPFAWPSSRLDHHLTLHFFPTVFIFILHSSVAIWMNSAWVRRLATATPHTLQANLGRFSLRELLLLVGAIAMVTGVVSRRINSASPIPAGYAEHVSASAVSFKLPVGATDVSYCRTFSGRTAYEFICGEPSFRNWIDEHLDTAGGIPLSEARPPYHTVWRYCSLTPRLKGANSVVINNGLFCVGTIGEKSFIVAYDRGTGRAYYYAH